MYSATLTPILDEKAAIYEAATKYDIWQAHNNLGAVYMEKATKSVTDEERKENLTKAVAQLKIAKVKEENAVVLNNIAAIQLTLGSREDAYKNYKKAYGMDAADSVKKVVAVGLGTCEIKYGNYDEAIKYLEEGASEVDKGMFNLGLAQLLKKDYEAAENSFEAAVSLNNKDALANYCSAIVGARTKKADLLETKLKQAISLSEDLREYAMKDLEFDLYRENEAYKNAIQ